MSIIVVRGGEPLVGEVLVSGSKNAALPIIFASIITKGCSVISNVPNITDVENALEILRSLGATVSRCGGTVSLDTSRLTLTEPDESKVSCIRASTYLLGAMLSRFGECRIGPFGGCAFSKRPIDLHIAACEAFGGSLKSDVITASRLHGAKIHFPKKSVGATINSLILAASAEGESEIYGYAREPHVLSLIDYLTSAGADIRVNEEKISVSGRPLDGGRITVIGDMIEAGTYLTAGLITRGRIGVRGCRAEELFSFLSTLSSFGACVETSGDCIYAGRGSRDNFCNVVCEAYPGFPTDLQPIIAPLLASGRGGYIRDLVWQERYGYLSSLSPFGLKHSRESGGAIIYESAFSAARAASPDLRGGAAAVLAALCAKGESIIEKAEYVLRGYENVEEKFNSVGANVRIYDT